MTTQRMFLYPLNKKKRNKAVLLKGANIEKEDEGASLRKKTGVRAYAKGSLRSNTVRSRRD